MADMASVKLNIVSTNAIPRISSNQEELPKAPPKQAPTCSLCKKSFFNKSTLNAHMANVHDKKKNHKCL